MTAPQFFHGGAGHFRPGLMLRPRTRTDAYALDRSPGGLARVYCSTNPWNSLQYAVARGGLVYEVKPLGRPERDLEGPVYGWMCANALVLREFMRPTRREREQMEALQLVAADRVDGPVGVRGTRPWAAAIRNHMRDIINEWEGQVPEEFADIPKPYLALTSLVFVHQGAPMREKALRPWVECQEPLRCGAVRHFDPHGDERCILCGLREEDEG